MRPNLQFSMDDVEERIEELESELTELLEAYDELDLDLEPEGALEVTRQMASLRDETDELEELLELRKLRDDNDSCDEFIAEEYFLEYITDLVNECYALPKELDSTQWPYRHIKIDYEAAADEAQRDYCSVTLFGKTYLAR